MTLWAVKWRSQNTLDGSIEYFIYRSLVPVVFPTRKLAREFINREFGYIRGRPDLRGEPYGWKMPIPVKVTIRTEEVAA